MDNMKKILQVMNINNGNNNSSSINGNKWENININVWVSNKQLFDLLDFKL
jgi:hypothetical protein